MTSTKIRVRTTGGERIDLHEKINRHGSVLGKETLTSATDTATGPEIVMDLDHGIVSGVIGETEGESRGRKIGEAVLSPRRGTAEIEVPEEERRTEERGTTRSRIGLEKSLQTTRVKLPREKG